MPSGNTNGGMRVHTLDGPDAMSHLNDRVVRPEVVGSGLFTSECWTRACWTYYQDERPLLLTVSDSIDRVLAQIRLSIVGSEITWPGKTLGDFHSLLQGRNTIESTSFGRAPDLLFQELMRLGNGMQLSLNAIRGPSILGTPRYGACFSEVAPRLRWKEDEAPSLRTSSKRRRKLRSSVNALFGEHHFNFIVHTPGDREFEGEVSNFYQLRRSALLKSPVWPELKEIDRSATTDIMLTSVVSGHNDFFSTALYQLTKEGASPIAQGLVIVEETRHLLYMSTYDTSWASYSPSHSALQEYLRSADKATELSFGRGNESYKYDLGGEDERLFEIWRRL